jgi:hypothetical protein
MLGGNNLGFIDNTDADIAERFDHINSKWGY